jgi:hypothetical protein
MLRGYQVAISDEACCLLKQYHIAYLAMHVRTGKTLTALAAAEKYGARTVLFITKLKAIESIKDDYKKLNPSFQLVVINFEQAHNCALDYDLIIIDEAHSLGQFPQVAVRTKAIKKICEGKPIIYLSGTPSPESYSQLFHQFYVSSYSPFTEATFYKWASSYVYIKKKYFHGHAINDYSSANKEKIDAVCRHLFISYTQEEAGFTSAVEEEILTVRMQPFTYKVIDALKKDRIYTSSRGTVILGDTAVKLRNKHHQLCSGSIIDEAGNSLAFDDSKVLFIKERFEGEKIAIYYKFRGEELLIRSLFDNVTTSPEEFNSSSDKIFISQVQSGREGVNLSSADAIIMLNIDYSALSYFQARARLQTRDRKAPSKVYWIFAEGGIEEKIYQCVANKVDYTLSHYRRDFKIKKDEELEIVAQSN